MPISEKHLEMIQTIVARLASNSYAYKGWSVTIAAGLVAFLASSHQTLLIASIYPILAFWFLDGHSLALERAFRKLYDEARLGNVADYSLNLTGIRRPVFDQIDAMLSLSLALFYGSAVVFVVIMAKALAK